MSQRSFFAVVLTSVVFLSFFFNRGFAYYDEGFILHGAQRILQGELPYRDFDFIYTPGTIFLVAAAFKLFGQSILVGRILVVIVAILTSLLVFTATNKLTRNKLTSYLAVLIYLSWGPSHINFPWPTLFAFSSGLLATVFLGQTIRGSRNKFGMTNAFLSGIMAFITFLFKQNFGAAVLLSSVVGMTLIKQKIKIRNFLRFFLGIFTGLLIFFIYLFLTNSLVSFFDNFYFYTVKKILFYGVASSGFPAGFKGIFYLSPGIISLVVVVKAWRTKSMIFPLFILLFYLFGIKPTTDYVHLTMLLAMTGIPLAIVAEKSKSAIYSIIISLIALGIYTGLGKNYYRWDTPLIKQNSFINDSRAKIFVDRKFKTVIPEVLTTISKEAKKGDYLFVFPNAPMFYFLSNRKNPTRFINLPVGLHTREQEKEIVDDLKKRQVKLILTHEESNKSSYTLITQFILSNFRKKKDFFEFVIWERKL